LWDLVSIKTEIKFNPCPQNEILLLQFPREFTLRETKERRWGRNVASVKRNAEHPPLPPAAELACASKFQSFLFYPAKRKPGIKCRLDNKKHRCSWIRRRCSVFRRRGSRVKCTHPRQDSRDVRPAKIILDTPLHGVSSFITVRPDANTILSELIFPLFLTIQFKQETVVIELPRWCTPSKNKEWGRNWIFFCKSYTRD